MDRGAFRGDEMLYCAAADTGFGGGGGHGWWVWLGVGSASGPI